MIVHCCLDVRGALKMTKRQLAGMFRDSAGRRMSADQVRDELMNHLTAGHEVIPAGPICDGFDFKTGCPGHEEEKAAYPPERFQSNAQWPLEVYRGIFGDGISTDNHQTREEAQAVCDGLNRDGFGGQRVHFPMRVWVSEVKA